jgi:hypothetical protein
MKVTEQPSRDEWAIIGSVGRRDEKVKIPAIRHLADEATNQRAQAINLQMRCCALQTQNEDKRFDRYVHCNEPDLPVTTTLWVEAGFHKENHRCILSG